MDTKQLIKSLNHLYDYGETPYSSELAYLSASYFIIANDDIVTITKKWITFTNKLKRKDFISALLCYYPPLLQNLLIRAYQEALRIGKSGDSNSLFEFINAIPNFASQTQTLKNEQLNETSEIKKLYQEIFKGLPQYLAILTKLKEMQKAIPIDDIKNTPLGKTPDSMWTANRKISSKEILTPLNKINIYTLTPYNHVTSKGEKEDAFILSSPWRLFMTQLLLVSSEYRAEGFTGISIRPSSPTDPYLSQELNLFIFNTSGKEILLSSIDQFAYEFCGQSKFYLFPDQPPEVSKALFSMLDKNLIEYRDNEYRLMPDFEGLIYLELRTLKNQSGKFRKLIKAYVESLRESL